MKLVGRVITRTTTEVKGQPASVMINPVNGSMRFNPVATIKLDMEGKTIAFGYPEEEDTEQSVYMYFTEDDGFKVGKGQVSSRHHTRELARVFDVELTEKFKLNIDLTPVKLNDFPDIEFYKVTFDSPEVTNTQETAEEVETTTMVKEEEVINTISEGISLG